MAKKWLHSYNVANIIIIIIKGIIRWDFDPTAPNKQIVLWDLFEKHNATHDHIIP